jgi:hypothetical protein
MDLRALRDAVGKVSEREWEHCYLTPDEAAAILGITPKELANLVHQPMHLDFGGELGVRYWREAVEARKEGWLTPSRWTQEGWLDMSAESGSSRGADSALYRPRDEPLGVDNG